MGRGPALVTFDSATFFTRDDIVPRHAPVWNPVPTSMYGEVDKYKRDLVIKIPLQLWGAWENMDKLFPSSYLNPVVGSSVFTTSDKALVVHARNSDKITYHNARITKVADLFLGVDSDLFAASVEFTALIKNNTNPEDSDAYYSVATAELTEDAFAKTNFKRARWTGAWGAKAGFTTIVPQKGFNVSWNLGMSPVTVDGLGTVDMTLTGLIATCRCIPLAPTLAQLEAQMAAQGKAHGSLLSGSGADLTLTAGSNSVVLKSAGPIEHGYAFGVEPLRIGEMGWETTRGFSSGVAAAMATVT